MKVQLEHLDHVLQVLFRNSVVIRPKVRVDVEVNTYVTHMSQERKMYRVPVRSEEM